MSDERKYRVAFVEESTGRWDVVETFTAADDEAANRHAEERYPGRDWYVLDELWRNVNGGTDGTSADVVFSRHRISPTGDSGGEIPVILVEAVTLPGFLWIGKVGAHGDRSRPGRSLIRPSALGDLLERAKRDEIVVEEIERELVEEDR